MRYTNNKEHSHFIELAKNLSYVKKIEIDYDLKGSTLNNHTRNEYRQL